MKNNIGVIFRYFKEFFQMSVGIDKACDNVARRFSFYISLNERNNRQ